MDLTLIAIVLGLGVTELLLSFYSLVRARRLVSWDALPLAWALVILVAVVNYWWGIRLVTAEASGWTTFGFLAAMTGPVFLFLACAAALPKADGAEAMDLRAAWALERRAFFLFFLLYHTSNWILNSTGLLPWPPLIVVLFRAANCIALAPLLFTRSRTWDWVALAVVVAAYAARLVTQIVQ
jgi:hypothetical protein